jgi:hypothetical protein
MALETPELTDISCLLNLNMETLTAVCHHIFSGSSLGVEINHSLQVDI